MVGFVDLIKPALLLTDFQIYVQYQAIHATRLNLAVLIIHWDIAFMVLGVNFFMAQKRKVFHNCQDTKSKDGFWIA